MKIKKITEDKDRFMNLLLLGDEQESMIYRYLERGELFALYDTDLKPFVLLPKKTRKLSKSKILQLTKKNRGKDTGV